MLYSKLHIRVTGLCMTLKEPVATKIERMTGVRVHIATQLGIKTCDKHHTLTFINGVLNIHGFTLWLFLDFMTQIRWTNHAW